jgi:hypothetical protein
MRTTGTATDTAVAAERAGTWLGQGAAVDSQRAFGTWHHYPIASTTGTAPTPRKADPDIPGYLTEAVPSPPVI